VRFSEACERNQEPILLVLRDWLPPRARVLEVGSGSGQHAVHFARHLAGLQWQPSDRAEYLGDLRERISLEGGRDLAPGARLADPIELDVDSTDQWPQGPYEAVFSANTTHIMAAASVPRLLAGAARVLAPGGLMLLYGPFLGGDVPTAPSNAAFDAHLRSLDPAMGIRDAQVVKEQALSLGLEAVADGAMPANNRILVFRKRGEVHSSIDISSVSQLNNVDDAGLIINKVDNSIVALAETIEIRPARELFRP
jgi:SAM-dependent methyltransferase